MEKPVLILLAAICVYYLLPPTEHRLLGKIVRQLYYKTAYAVYIEIIL
jgi:hypothetical protein